MATALVSLPCPSPPNQQSHALPPLPLPRLYLGPSLPQEDFGGLRGDDGDPTGGLDGRPRVEVGQEVEEEVTGGGGRGGQEVHEGGPFEGEGGDGGGDDEDHENDDETLLGGGG